MTLELQFRCVLFFYVVDNHGAFIILHIYILEKAKQVQGCEAVCSFAEVGPGLGFLTQSWMLLLGALTGKANVGGVRGREMDKKTSWGLLAAIPDSGLTWDHYGSTTQCLVGIYTGL